MTWVKSKLAIAKPRFSYEAEHRSDVLPSEIAKVISEKPNFSFGTTPKGFVHTIVINGEPTKVAVRPLESFKGFFYFHALKNCHDKGMDVVDTPIALVTSKRGRVSHLITEWHEGAVNLKDYYSTHKLSAEARLVIAKLAMHELAKLHNAGYYHGHPHLGNFVTYPNSNRVKVNIVDPTMLNTSFRSVSNEDKFSDAVIAAVGFVQNLRGLKKLESVEPDDALILELLNEYMQSRPHS